MTKITGASFTNCTIGGRPMNSGDTPFVGRNGNIAWPDGCTREQRRDWRMMADEPGHEWPGAAAEEPPFDAFDRFLAAVASDDPEFRAREARRAASRERRPGIPTRTVAAGLLPEDAVAFHGQIGGSALLRIIRRRAICLASAGRRNLRINAPAVPVCSLCYSRLAHGLNSV